MNNKQWIKDFHKQFNINPTEKTYWRIIVGQEAYKQTFGTFPIKSQNPSTYTNNNLGNIAFLVNDFIKIQSSLEMIFNLLGGNPQNGLKMLSFLRDFRVSSKDFGDYLFNQHKILLLNKCSINSNFYKFISYYHNNIYLLVGLEAGKLFSNPQLANNSKAIIIHPSNLNLNTGKINTIHGQYDKTITYYNSWYNLNDNYLLKKDNAFSLAQFRL